MQLDTKDYPKFAKMIKEELKIFNNFSAILEKTETDGYMQKIAESLILVFNSEIKFALKGKLIRTTKTQRKKEKFGPKATFAH